MKYDKTSPRSIEQYAKELIGKTFQDVINENVQNTFQVEEEVATYGNTRRKGGLGNLLEEVYFGYKANSESAADFEEAGVELKVTPYEINSNGSMRAGERLVLSMINYSGPIEPSLYDSHLWEKCKILLLIYYLRDKSLTDNLQYRIDFASLFTPTSKDLAIIENDYKIIADKVMAGKAEELSESDTFYLGACTKGSTAAKSIVNQYYPPHTPAKKRAFCYKNSYMTYVLNEYIANGTDTCESLIDDVAELKGKTFSEYIISKINSYAGLSDRILCEKFDREYNNNKAQWTDLAYRMLGIRSNKAEEFKKANVAVKVIRLKENGNMKESMSFPAFRYRELIRETWEDSTVHNYFEETKFLFVVFKKHGNEYILKGCQMWNMPYFDLENIVKPGWEAVVSTIKSGVALNKRYTSTGIVIKNNFPGKKDNEIIHVRPHARHRYYEFLNGEIVGDGTRANANQLPDGTWMTDYSFWINNSYILKQLNGDLTE